MRVKGASNRLIPGAILGTILLIGIGLSSVHASEDPAFELRVAKGDYLINICKKYLENPEGWTEVAKRNSLKNPNRIFPGQTLLIPVRLLRGIPQTCEVTFLKGDVRVRKESEGSWIPLRRGDRVIQGDSVQTGHESAAELTFEGGATFFLRADTLLKVETNQKKGPVHIIRDFFLNIGNILVRIPEATGTDSRHKIRTPSAAASARGTEFRVSVDPEASTRSEVLNGMIEVGGMNRYVELREKEGTLVKPGQPPLSPRKLLPPPMPIDLKPVYKRIPFPINFERIKDSSLTRVMVTADRDSKDILQEKDVRPGEAVEISGLRDGSYYLFTRSMDGVGLEGPPSEPLVLKLRVNPVPPFIQLPRRDTEFRERSVEIRWLKVEDAASYHLQVAEDPEFSMVREEKAGIKGEAYRTGDLDYKTYYFRVRSVASDGYEGDWSKAERFRVIPPPPIPALEKPEAGGKTIHLRWPAPAEIKNFHFQMAKDREFKDILVDKKIDQPGVLVPKPKVPGVYHVRVSSVDSKGYEGEFSGPQSFELKPPAPPHLETPEVDEQTIRLRWNSSGEEAGYHLQLAREETFQTILRDQKVRGTSINLKKPDEPGIYYVRVSGIDADENEGAFSRAEKVEVKEEIPIAAAGGVGTIVVIIGLMLLGL